MKNNRRKEKRLAANLIMYWISEAWNDLNNDYYKKRLDYKSRKLTQEYIHRYGRIIGFWLRCKYRPH